MNGKPLEVNKERMRPDERTKEGKNERTSKEGGECERETGRHSDRHLRIRRSRPRRSTVELNDRPPWW